MNWSTLHPLKGKQHLHMHVCMYSEVFFSLAVSTAFVPNADLVFVNALLNYITFRILST